VQDKTRQDKTRPRNRFVREFTGLRSRAQAALRKQSLALPDGSTLPTEELQKLVHEPHDSYRREPDTISLVILAIDSEAMESIHKPYDTTKLLTAVSNILNKD
jgi:hypothetical protein